MFETNEIITYKFTVDGWTDDDRTVIQSVRLTKTEMT